MTQHSVFETTTTKASSGRVNRGSGSVARTAHKLKVLVIDDNQAIHEDIRKILGERQRPAAELSQLESALFGSDETAPAESAWDSFEVSAAADGKAGVELARAALRDGDPYMVAFVDMRMPAGWDGLETIERLWEVDPLIQVVICSAYSDRSWGEITARLGQTDSWLVLKKPFETIEVLQAAHALCRKWLLGQTVRGHVEDLERIVEHRTRDLARLNEELVREVQERRAAEETLKHLATHDSLTGLANRLLLREQLNTALARSRRYGKPIAFMLCDLDGFKQINDSLGHDAGDELLRQVAKRLGGCARACDTVARLGGDEFALLLTDLTEEAASEIVAKRIVQALAQPIELAGRAVHISASVGIAAFPGDCDNAENLIKCADIALYAVKENGKAGFQRYTPGTIDRASQRVNLRDELRAALQERQFELWYQPLHDLSDRSIAGTEALIRWRHPERGLIPPMHFMQVAEESGLIVPIGEWVLREACRQNAAWHRAGGPQVPVAVNLSTRQFEQKDLVEQVRAALTEADLQPRFLELEVTETCVMRDIARSAQVLQALRNLGVRIAIDDFGSGYSSLARLKLLPVDVLKLDRLFIQNVADDERDAAIVGAVVALAGSLGIQVIAEGIETIEQLNALRGLAWKPVGTNCCQRGQGFLFSKPLPATDTWRTLTGGAT